MRRLALAEERTLLAWVRTGLALMGFGFVVARFGLFLREMAVMHPGPQPAERRAVGLVRLGAGVVGVGVNAIGAAPARPSACATLERGEIFRPRPLFGVARGARCWRSIGLGMATYLLLLARE